MVVGRIVAIALLTVSCSNEASEFSDAGGTDSDASIDAQPVSGFGTLSGDCNVLDDELVSTQPGIFELELHFERAYTEEDANRLSAGASRILTQGNAGGSSGISEAFAFDVLSRCESAVLLKTENEIQYDGDGKMTDFLAEMDGVAIGVSVTRAVAYPFSDPFLAHQAKDLLSGKLEDVLASSGHVSAADAWQKQILAVMAYGAEHGAALVAAFETLDAELRSDSLVLVIVTEGDDDFIYCNGPCAL